MLTSLPCDAMMLIPAINKHSASTTEIANSSLGLKVIILCGNSVETVILITTRHQSIVCVFFTVTLLEWGATVAAALV